MLAADAYQNAANQFDVNGDGHVSPLDALSIINDLNKYGTHALTPLASDSAGSGPQTVTAQASSAQSGGSSFVDVNGDGIVSPLDALKVINALNSNDVVQVTFVATDMNGVPISSVPVGSTFQLEALVADVSGTATAPVGTALGNGGVFEAEIDGAYNNALASIDPNATVAFGPEYLNGEVSNLSTPGQIIGTGSFATFQVPLGPGQFELWSIPVTATAVGTETFTPSPGTAINSKGFASEVAVFGNDNPIPNSQIDFEPGSVNIVAAATPVISISPASVARPTSGTINEVFNVTLTHPSSTTATTVHFSTVDGTAKAGTDYVGQSNQTLTFPAGATSENITVVVNGSTAYDPSSNFTVSLSSPTNGAVIGTTQATGTITSTAAAPTFAISGPTTVIRQASGVQNEVYTVKLTGATELYAAVNYTTADGNSSSGGNAIAGTDYTATSGQLVFQPGTTSETITVPILGNTSTTGNASFTINLRTPTNATVAITVPSSSFVPITIEPPPTVDLSITKADNKGGSSSNSTTGNVTPGSAMTYTIVVSNSGPSTATGAAVADTFPAGISSDTWTATASGGATGFTASSSGPINDTAVNLPAGSTVTYTVLANVSASASGTLTNTATVTAPAGVTDTNTANNSATDIDNLVPTADLSITKTDNKGGSSITNSTGSVVPGSSLTYTVVVHNAGPVAVTGAAVSDTLPAGISSDTWTATATGGATGFTTSPSTGAINDTNVSLPVNSTITYVIVANVAASASGTLMNTATVTSPTSPIDPNLTNNSATDKDTVVQTADLSISKTDNKGGSSVTHTTGSVVPGTTLTYTVVVTNNGPSAANGVKIADTLPAGVVSDAWTATASGGATGFTASSSGAINDTAVNMPSGSTVTYTVTANVSSSATGTLSNTATVTAPAGVSDPTSANNSATDSDTLTPTADLSITKIDNKGGSSITSTPGNVTPGNPLTYTIVVSNAGPSNASGVKVADTLPAGISSDTWTATASGGATGFTASSSGAINDTAVSLPSGSSVTYTILANVSGSAFGTLSNTATVTAAAGTTDPNSANNSATDTDNLVPTADLTVTKTDNKGGSSISGATGTTSPGSTVTYTITVTNAGPVAANGAQIADTFPAGITSDSYTATATGGATGFTASSTGNINDAAVNMPAGSSVTYIVTAVTDPAAIGLLSNTATVTAPAGVTDPNTVNNTATDKLNLVPQTDLSITKVDNVGGSSITNTVGTATNGGSITYTIIVTNNGPANATGTTIADTMPAAFSGDSFAATATGGATGFTANGSGNIHDTAVNLPVGATVTYVVTANLASSFAGSVSNTATVTAPAGDSDPNSANNSATDTDTVPGIADLSVTKTDNVGGSSTASTTGSVIPGQQIVYTVVVTNNGPSNVTGATIADALPSGVSSATFSATATGGATGFKASGTGSINDTAVNMPVGSTVTYTVTANVNSAATGTLTNTATASVPAGYTDPVSGNNSATDSDTLTPTADLSITKVDNRGGSSVTSTTGNVVKGQSITYTIVVTNSGPSAASGASVVDTLPASIASDTFTAVATGGASGFTASSGTGNIADTNVNLPAGSTVTYTVVAMISASAASGMMSNMAAVTAPSGVVDANTANNSATDADNVAVFTPSSLAGVEFVDSNADGIRESGELAIQNATIHLTGTDFLNATVNLTTNPAADGSYSFGNPNPGTYTITSVQSSMLTAGQAIVGSEPGTAIDANDIQVTIGPAGGITGTGNNFTEKGFASAAISERLLLASNQLNGTVNLNDTTLFPPTASSSVTSSTPAASAVSSSSLLASNAVASAPSSITAVDAAFADPAVSSNDDAAGQLGAATASQNSSAVDQALGMNENWLLA